MDSAAQLVWQTGRRIDRPAARRTFSRDAHDGGKRHLASPRVPIGSALLKRVFGFRNGKPLFYRDLLLLEDNLDFRE
jgi:hypothetical protein